LVYDARKAPEQAQQAFDRAIAADPANSLAWYHRGVALERRGDASGGIEAYRRSLALSPGRLEVREALGQALLARAAWDEAGELLRGVVTERPDRGMARFGLALAALETGDAETAVREAASAARLLPDYARGQMLLFQAALSSGRLDLADSALTSAARLGVGEPALSEARAALARARDK
jgi:Tfp pilus assembly protein PilF